MSAGVITLGYGIFLGLQHRHAEAMDYLRESGDRTDDPDRVDYFVSAVAHQHAQSVRDRQVLVAAATAGDLEAALQLGDHLARDGELVEAERMWLGAWEAGSIPAALRLGDLAVQRADPAAAERYYQWGTDRGDVVAAVRCGMVLHYNEEPHRAAAVFGAAGGPAADAWLAVVTGVAAPELGDAASADAELMHAHGLLARARGDEDEAQRWLGAAADRGSPRAIQDLAQPFLRDRPDVAALWLTVGANRHDPFAAAALAVVLGRLGMNEQARHYADWAAENGLGIGRWHLLRVLNEHSATGPAGELADLLVDGGQPEAIFNRGVVLEQSGDLEGARDSYRIAADAGLAKAATNLHGVLLSLGDEATAEEALRRAVDLGDPLAYVRAGIRLMDDDPAEAKRLFRSAAVAGDLDGATALAAMLHRDGDTRAAIDQVLPFAADDHPRACRAIAEYHYLIDELDAAEYWAQRGAQRGDAGAAYRLSRILRARGDGRIADRWLRNAANWGWARAADEVGDLFLSAALPGAAEHWYRRALDLGHANAALDVAIAMHAQNRSAQAQEWLRRKVNDGVISLPFGPLPPQAQISVAVTRPGPDTEKGYTLNLHY